MVGIYALRQDFADAMDLTLDAINFPKDTLVDTWITASEAEIDRITGRTFVQGTNVEQFRLQSYSQVLFLKQTPIIGVPTIEYNAAVTQFDTPVWTSAPFKVLDANIGMIKLQYQYNIGRELRFSYTGGYLTMPDNLRELAIALTKRRLLNAYLSQTASDVEIVSIASIRISERSNSSVENSLKNLELEIEALYDSLPKADKYQLLSVGY